MRFFTGKIDGYWIDWVFVRFEGGDDQSLFGDCYSRQFRFGDGWRVMDRLDGLDAALALSIADLMDQKSEPAPAAPVDLICLYCVVC